MTFDVGGVHNTGEDLGEHKIIGEEYRLYYRDEGR
jgi:hypothetical protein